MVLTLDRQFIIEQLISRDGLVCQYPGCDQPLVYDETSRHYVTIDHKFPQGKAREAGWTFEEIWDLSNLQLMGRACNSKKSDRTYDDDGMLTPTRTHTKVVKSERPEQCETCGSGRLLLLGEICDVCGSGPQPSMAPRSTQKLPKECSHAGYDHCWMCWIGFVERKSAFMTILTGDE